MDYSGAVFELRMSLNSFGLLLDILIHSILDSLLASLKQGPF